jgi:N-methylhydantoinase B
MGSYRIYLIYGSQDCSVDYKPYGGVAQGGFGLSGGYPTGIGGNRVMIDAGLEMLDKVRKGDHPTGQAMRAGEWGKSFLPAGVPERIPLPEGSLLVDYVAGGGGFGDPIDRDPQAVLKDFARQWVSLEVAERVYGVVLDRERKGVDISATEARRREIRESRKQSAAPVSGKTSTVSESVNGWRSLLRFHAVLEISGNGKQRIIRCTRCNHPLCKADENYKLYALHRSVHLEEIMPPLPTGEPYIGEYHEYFCPGCATQLQVDLFSPSLGGDPILWDTRIQ